MTHYDFPQELVDDLAHQNCVVFVGSGASAGCKDDDGKFPPTWSRLMEHLCEGLDADIVSQVNKQLSTERFLDAAEIVFNNCRHDRIYSKLEDLLARKFAASAVHRALVDLDQRLYVTTNFDTILDTHLRSELRDGVIVKYQTQKDIVSVVRRKSKLLIKLHGSIDDRNSIVLTRSQYASAKKESCNAYDLLDALFLTKTVLFVGCGTSDPDIELLFEDAKIMHPGAPPHYMIKLRSDAELQQDRVISETRNISMLYYPDSHDNLPVLLNELATLVDSRRSLASISRPEKQR